ncbi:MAG: hypothetical protein IJU15_00275 [Synergistaceae bacterium]|nr:hypothetical protein [Synergistaceae bacterium]MBQ9403398.1 hypothetical protein [Synergistaceae bacterium]MBR0203382.1 hypothetical protein [Synergistaceae bacterium]
MYFQWRSTPYGIIRISCEGLYNFADRTIKSKLRLYSVTLSPFALESESKTESDSAGLSIVFIDEENLQDQTRDKIKSHYEAVLKPMGIISEVIWAAPDKGIAHILQNSWTWAGIAACAAIITTAGFEGFFWTAFWGSAAWFAVRALALITRFFRGA